MMELNSKITRELLGYFISHEDETLYVNEIVRRLKLDKRNLVKKLGGLVSIGLFKIETKGNLKIYSLNKDFPLYAEYKKIFLSTIGIVPQLREIFKGLDGVERAFIFGSYAKGKADALSDIDVFVIGGHSSIELQKRIGQLQKKYDREINLISISKNELERKKSDPFISEIMKGKKIEII